jgi:hypothetical protein
MLPTGTQHVGDHVAAAAGAARLLDDTRLCKAAERRIVSGAALQEPLSTFCRQSDIDALHSMQLPYTRQVK